MEFDDRKGIVVLTGNSHPELAKLVVQRLGMRLGECTVLVKPNRETQVDIKQSVRNKDVFIIESGGKDVNNTIMELMIMIYACKTSSARSVNVIMPYMPYSKQCKMWRRGSIAGKLVAEMICKAGASRFITMDLYRKEIQGFFRVPVDNLRASPFLLSYIKEHINDYKNAVIVAKNPGCLNKAMSYAERLRLAIAVIHGERKKDESEQLDGRNSPPLLDDEEGLAPERPPTPEAIAVARSTLPPPEFEFTLSAVPCSLFTRECSSWRLISALVAKEKPPLTVVGDVGGKIAIMVDDIVDEVESFVDAALVLHERGAYKIYVVATHGLLSADAPSALENSHIDEIVVTNTVPHDVQKLQCHKIRTVDVSLMLSEAIRRIYHNESMSYLFKDVTLDD